MTSREYFFLFVAIFGWICGFVAINESEKTEEENGRLRDKLLTEHRRAEYFKRKSEHNAVFDFEKVNSKEEK